MLDVNGWEDILCGVDIGTEWNLKYIYMNVSRARERVDIGTEWNLKDGSDLASMTLKQLI